MLAQIKSIYPEDVNAHPAFKDDPFTGLSSSHEGSTLKSKKLILELWRLILEL
jgi:hypothetical protein